MTRTFIRNCAWGYSCDKKWDALRETDDKKVKFCDACEREVHMSLTPEELAKNVSLNRCVSFKSDIISTDTVEVELLGFPSFDSEDDDAQSDIPF